MVGAAYAQVRRRLLGAPWKMVRTATSLGRTATSLGFRVWDQHSLLLTQATAGRRCSHLSPPPGGLCFNAQHAGSPAVCLCLKSTRESGH